MSSSDNLNLAFYEPLLGIRANFICDQYGNFQVDGSSRPLSNEIDRALLIHLRALTDAVVIGGQTARSEHYVPTNRFETFVFTRKPLEKPGGLLPLSFERAEELPGVFEILLRSYPRILIEAGPSLVSSFLKLGIIDQLCLTINGLENEESGFPVRLFDANLGEPNTVQTVGTFRFCIWNL